MALALTLPGAASVARRAPCGPERPGPEPRATDGQDEPQASIERFLEDLAEAGARGPEALQEVARTGVELGGQAAAAALLGGGERFRALGLDSRRARVWLLLSSGDERAIEPALGLLGDPDPSVRTGALAFLSEPELKDARVAERARALGRLALEATDPEAVSGALGALARIDRPRTTEELISLLERLGAPSRALAARALAIDPRAGGFLVETVQAAFAGERALPTDALVELLAAYGERLAELPQGGAARRDRAPFVLGARHPDPSVRLLASVALERYVARLRRLGELERAAATLRALVRDGTGPGLSSAALLERAAVLALTRSADPAPALEAARELRLGTEASAGDLEGRRLEADGWLLEAAALVALGREDEAPAALDAAEHALAGLVAERLELGGSERLARLAVEVQLGRGALALHRALLALLDGVEPSDPRVLEHARAAHQHALEAQLAAYEGDLGSEASRLDFERVLLYPLSPLVLLLSNARRPELPGGGQALQLELALATAAATVAPLELPGLRRFEPLERRLAGPLGDPVREHLLRRIQEAFYTLYESEIERELDREFESDDPLRMVRAQMYRRMLEERRAQDVREGPRSRLRLRPPGRLAIVVASDLREHGRFQEAADLAARVRSDLESSDSQAVRPIGPFVDVHARDLLLAQAQQALGDAHMDLDDPAAAESALRLALERFEALAGILDRDPTRASGDEARMGQVDALVALAVNANVKQRDPQKASAWFERAYALRRDEFMQVLLACYLARAGEEQGAREALRDTQVIPDNYYNLACTYALLGDADTALDFLRRDLEQKRALPGSYRRQVEWAREDPDLASLRGDPRFEAVLGPPGGSTGPDRPGGPGGPGGGGAGEASGTGASGEAGADEPGGSR